MYFFVVTSASNPSCAKRGDMNSLPSSGKRKTNQVGQDLAVYRFRSTRFKRHKQQYGDNREPDIPIAK